MKSVFVAALAASASALKTKEALPWFEAIETGTKLGQHSGSEVTYDVVSHNHEDFADGTSSHSQSVSQTDSMTLTTTPASNDLEGSTNMLKFEHNGKVRADYDCDFAFTQDFQGHVTHIHHDADPAKEHCVKAKTALANLFETHASESGDLEFTKHQNWHNDKVHPVDFKMNIEADGKMTVKHTAKLNVDNADAGMATNLQTGTASESGERTMAADGTLDNVNINVHVVAGAGVNSSAEGGVTDIQAANNFKQVETATPGDGGAGPQLIGVQSDTTATQSGTNEVELVEMPAGMVTKKYEAPAVLFDSKSEAKAEDEADASYAAWDTAVEKGFAHLEHRSQGNEKIFAEYAAKDLAAGKRSVKQLRQIVSHLGGLGEHGQETLVSLVEGKGQFKDAAFAAFHNINNPSEATLESLWKIADGKTKDACTAEIALGAMAANFDEEGKIEERLFQNFQSSKAFGKTNGCGLLGLANARMVNVETFEEVKAAITVAKKEGNLREAIMLYDSLRLAHVAGVDTYLNAEFQSIDAEHHKLLVPLMDTMTKRQSPESEKTIETIESLVQSGAITNPKVQRKLALMARKRSQQHHSPAAHSLIQAMNSVEGWNNIQEGDQDEIESAHCATSASGKISFYNDGANFSGENGRVSGHADDDWIYKLAQELPWYKKVGISALGKTIEMGYEVYGGLQGGADLGNCQLWASAGAGAQIFVMETDSDMFDFRKSLVEGFAGAQFDAADTTFSMCAYMKYFKVVSVSLRDIVSGSLKKTGVICEDGWKGSSCNCKGNSAQKGSFSGCCSWHGGLDAGRTCRDKNWMSGDTWLLSPIAYELTINLCSNSDGCDSCAGLQPAPGANQNDSDADDSDSDWNAGGQLSTRDSGTQTLISTTITFSFWGLITVSITCKLTSTFYTQTGYALMSGTNDQWPQGDNCGYPGAYAYYKPGVIFTFTIIADVGVGCAQGYKDPLPNWYACVGVIGFGGDLELIDFGTPITVTANIFNTRLCGGIAAEADFFGGRLFVRAAIACLTGTKLWGRRRRRRRWGGCAKGPDEYDVFSWGAPTSWSTTILQTMCCYTSSSRRRLNNNRRRRGVPNLAFRRRNVARRRRRSA